MFQVSLVSMGVFEGDIALKAFKAAELLRERYGIEVIIDYVINYAGEIYDPASCEVLIQSGGKAVVIDNVDNVNIEHLADIILDLIFGGSESGRIGRSLASSRGLPEGMAGAIAT